jgi:hypothetical protein
MKLLGFLDGKTKWSWYSIALLISFLPVIIRLIVCIAVPSAIAFDIKDILFSGLAMNLSNINLVGHKAFKPKQGIAVSSSLLILIIGIILALFLQHDLSHNERSLTGLVVAGIVIVLASVYVSYEANDYLFAKRGL